MKFVVRWALPPLVVRGYAAFGDLGRAGVRAVRP